MVLLCVALFFFFLNDPPTTEISPLSLHDALPISSAVPLGSSLGGRYRFALEPRHRALDHLARALDARLLRKLRPLERHAHYRNRLAEGAAHLVDRKSTRLNSSHSQISYAVFCLKK